MTADDRRRMQMAARDSVSQRFSEATFDEGFLQWASLIMPK
jgi:hypothetical protein